MKQNINKELLKLSEKWVAITKNYTNIVVSGNSISEVEEKLETLNYDLNSVVIMYVNPPDKFLSPKCLS